MNKFVLPLFLLILFDQLFFFIKKNESDFIAIQKIDQILILQIT